MNDTKQTHLRPFPVREPGESLAGFQRRVDRASRLNIRDKSRGERMTREAMDASADGPRRTTPMLGGLLALSLAALGACVTPSEVGDDPTDPDGTETATGGTEAPDETETGYPLADVGHDPLPAQGELWGPCFYSTTASERCADDWTCVQADEMGGDEGDRVSICSPTHAEGETCDPVGPLGLEVTSMGGFCLLRCETHDDCAPELGLLCGVASANVCGWEGYGA